MKILIGVSGGPDSMLLLDLFKNKNIIVAHVNYNLRQNSDLDQKLVEKYCQKHGLKLYIHSVSEKPQKNLQNWARNIRYNFFNQIYKMYKCESLLLGHHNDDFIETGIFQNRTNRESNFFGIKKHNILFEMNIERPFINRYWKKDILKIVNQKNVPYRLDESNQDLSYERNKIRHELSSETSAKKLEILKWFLNANKIMKNKEEKVEKLLQKWANKKYDIKYFRTLEYKYEIVYKFLHSQISNLKLSSQKLESIVEYIKSFNNKSTYKLNDHFYLSKIKNQLKVNNYIINNT